MTTTTTSLLSRFQRVLLGTDGTVTRILEAYAEEPIDAVKLSQVLDTAGAGDTPLALPVGAEVLRRRVLLEGRDSGRHLLYAEAVVVPARVGLDVLDRLLNTDEPIGKLLSAARLETFREVLQLGREPAAACAHHFGVGPDAELLVRTYRIVARGEPIMLITEKFPAQFFLD